MDLNISRQKPFVQAAKSYLGEWGVAPMIAWGRLRQSAAYKMYARAEHLPYEESNAVSACIKTYEQALKYAEEDEKDDIRIEDYVSPQYIDSVVASRKYCGIVDNITPHACGHLLFEGDIRREIGIIRLKPAKKGEEDVLAAYIDGVTADRYGYLKLDFLVVTVISVNEAAFRRIGVPMPSADEIVKTTWNDPATWSMYEKGYTLGLNQVEGEKSTARVMRYKPKSIVELSAFIAAIRPSFKTQLDDFISRKHFDYGIPSFDRIIQTREIDSSWLLYQEQIMKALQHGGISPSDSYVVIKAISKKKHHVIAGFKEQFLRGFAFRVAQDEGLSPEKGAETAEKVWEIIENAAQYGFNASHAYCVAIDSLYGAYLKAHYPLEYYVTLLEAYSKAGDKARIARAKQEMRRAFGIRVASCRLGQDNRDYFVDKERLTISDALSSVKYMSRRAAEDLFLHFNAEIPDSFVGTLVKLREFTCLTSRQIDILVKLGYFKRFGGAKKLASILEAFFDGPNCYKTSYAEATKQKRVAALREAEKTTPDAEYTDPEKAAFEYSYYASPVSVFPSQRGVYCVLDVDTSHSAKLLLYHLATGGQGVMKVKKARFALNPVEPGNVIRIDDWGKKVAYRFAEGKPQPVPGKFDNWIYQYEKVL